MVEAAVIGVPDKLKGHVPLGLCILKQGGCGVNFLHLWLTFYCMLACSVFYNTMQCCICHSIVKIIFLHVLHNILNLNSVAQSVVLVDCFSIMVKVNRLLTPDIYCCMCGDLLH